MIGKSGGGFKRSTTFQANSDNPNLSDVANGAFDDDATSSRGVADALIELNKVKQLTKEINAKVKENQESIKENQKKINQDQINLDLKIGNLR